MNDYGWTAIGAMIGSIITGLFTWLAQRSKGASSIEVAVLGEWQKLNAALSDRVSALEKELAEVRRAHAAELEEMRREHRAELSALHRLNEGLQRQIAQNSHSTASLIGDITKDGGDA